MLTKYTQFAVFELGLLKTEHENVILNALTGPNAPSQVEKPM
jgi:hypothetical protein